MPLTSSWKILGPLALASLIVNGACVQVNRDTRVERGPVLRTFDREETIGPGGIHTQVEVAWPTMTLTFARYDLCRQERVEEVVEERITEQFAPAAAPSFSFGVSASLVGGGLMATRSLFSDAPVLPSRPGDPVGPSPRQVATTWSWVLLGTGVPALIVGVIGLAASGEQVERTRFEQVASSLERACKLRPADGTVTLWPIESADAAPISVVTSDGRVVFTADQLKGVRAATIAFDGAPAWVPEEAGRALEAYLACIQVANTKPAAELDGVAESELVHLYNVARSCEAVAPEVGREAAKAYADQIQKRRVVPESPQPENSTDGRP